MYFISYNLQHSAKVQISIILRRHVYLIVLYKVLAVYSRSRAVIVLVQCTLGGIGVVGGSGVAWLPASVFSSSLLAFTEVSGR